MKGDFFIVIYCLAVLQNIFYPNHDVNNEGLIYILRGKLTWPTDGPVIKATYKDHIAQVPRGYTFHVIEPAYKDHLCIRTHFVGSGGGLHTSFTVYTRHMDTCAKIPCELVPYGIWYCCRCCRCSFAITVSHADTVSIAIDTSSGVVNYREPS